MILPDVVIQFYCITLTASTVADQLEQNHGQETVTIQQGGQTVFQTPVQYVDSNDPALYATSNGQMYDIYCRCATMLCCGIVQHLNLIHA